MENLKKLFACSSDSVIITDYEFNILWCNRDEKTFSEYGDNCSELFKDQTLPLNSGTYYLKKYNGLFFECRIINYPDCGDGIYVIQATGDDVMYSALKCRGIKEFMMNHSGIVREAVTGINCLKKFFSETFGSSHSADHQKCSDIITGNCCKLLKPMVNTVELIHYSEGNYENSRIDLSSELEVFLNETSRILSGNVEIKKSVEPDLYINADTDRLRAFLLSLTVLTYGRNPENNIISFTAGRIGDYVSLTVQPDGKGVDYPSGVLTKHAVMYPGDEANSDLFIVNRFCETFGGTLFISNNNDKPKSYSVKFPFCDSTDEIKFRSDTSTYEDGEYSPYHIMYSEILY
ncbi:MAG: hypothetical protein ACI4JB_08940 [Porcipelethomonas sp.]